MLDKNGNKIKLPSGAWKSRRVDLTDWEKPETLLKWRENWAVTVNRVFERLGMDERIDHRTLEAQGIDREPTKHMGHKAWNLEKKGVKTRIGNQNRAIMERNQSQTPERIAEDIHQLQENYIVVENEITAIQQAINEVERKRRVAQIEAEEIEERAEHIQTMANMVDELKTQRQNMSLWTNKRDKIAIEEQIKNAERSHEQSARYFEREFHISPEEAPKAILRREIRAHNFGRIGERLRGKLPPLLEDKKAIIEEYYKQKLLMDIRRDGARIQRRLERLEREIKRNLTAKDRLVRDRILGEMEGMTAQKERSNERVRVREYLRGQ